MAKEVILTGIKPTGSPHLGNYMGMYKPALDMAHRNPEATCLFFIADYHALTAMRNPDEFRQLTHEVTATWLAFGLNPETMYLYRQSDIPEVFELTWLLTCVTPKGLMNRAHAYKAAVAENEANGAEDPDAGINMGLYNYPILMAADILLFDTDFVPVGQDQVQHVEIARDVAAAFNAAFRCDALKLPRHIVREAAGYVPGLDGRKMSKSYDNTIPLFAPPAQLKKLVSRIQTDSSAPDSPKDPDTSTIFLLYQEFAPQDKVGEMRERYRRGISWADAKKALFEALDAFLAEPRSTYEEFMNNPDRLEAILRDGASRARQLAQPVLARARAAVGRT